MPVGIFMVSALHNAVHLLFGLFGVMASRTSRFSRLCLIIGGAVYLALWIYGLVIDQDNTANSNRNRR